MGRWIRDPKDKTKSPTLVVPVLATAAASSLIRDENHLARWVPSRNIVPVGRRKPVPAILAAPPLPPAVAEDDDVIHEDNIERGAVGDWVIYSDANRPHVGVISNINVGQQLHLHSFVARRDGQFFPEWEEDGTMRIKASIRRPSTGRWISRNFLISNLAVLWRGHRAADTYKLPLVAEKCLADFRRDPHKVPPRVAPVLAAVPSSKKKRKKKTVAFAVGTGPAAVIAAPAPVVPAISPAPLRRSSRNKD